MKLPLQISKYMYIYIKKKVVQTENSTYRGHIEVSDVRFTNLKCHLCTNN